MIPISPAELRLYVRTAYADVCDMAKGRVGNDDVKP